MKEHLILFVALILLSISYDTCAQAILTEEQKSKVEQVNRMFKETLRLNEDQTKEVSYINYGFLENLNQIKNSGSSRFVKIRKLRNLSAERDQSMKTILDEDQYLAFKEIQERTRAEFRRNRGG
ncbi:MAG: hypothetical protein AAF363_21225 [Bacteroidota bacterium]